MIAALRRPFMLWMLILGVHLAVQSSALPPRAVALTSRGLLILWVLSLTLAGSSLVANLVRHYGPSLKGATPVTTLSQNLLRALVWSIGLLIILNQFGVSITPILTALGVGGLAVALALQETLSNLFAGLYVSVAGHLRVGDYIRLDSGEEGFVADISWRATTIRALANNLIVVPNSKLAQAIVTNYTLPEPRVSFGVPVNVSLESDPDHVERVLLDEATSAVGQIPGLVGDTGGPLQPRGWRVVPGLHRALRRRAVHRPVPRPARVAEAHLAAPACGADRHSVPPRGPCICTPLNREASRLEIGSILTQAVPAGRACRLPMMGGGV